MSPGMRSQVTMRMKGLWTTAALRANQVPCSRLALHQAPIIEAGHAVDPTLYADPVPQALVLTAIVIGFAMTAFVIMLALKARAELGNDHVDGKDSE